MMLTLTRNVMVVCSAVALCAVMAGCSSSGDDNSTDLQRQLDFDAAVANTMEKQEKALADAQFEVVVASAVEKNDGEATHVGVAYVTADRLNVRLAPSLSGKITNALDRGQKVDVLEVQGGWARISQYYDGFVEGASVEVARWVAVAYLSQTKPADNAVHVRSSASPLDRAISKSDDFHRYNSRFLEAAKQLISQQQCTSADFEEMGGWVRSTTRGRSVYFTYCGGLHMSNRIYLDATNGQTYR